MKEDLIKLLGLTKSATEQNIIAVVAKLVSRNQKAYRIAVRRRRIKNLQRVTHMTHENAIRCIEQQDAAAAQLKRR
jgi:hypothetical protein